VLACENNGTEKMYVETGPKVILPAGSLLKYVTVFLKDGKEVQVKNTTPVIFERNKRYAVRVSLDTKEMVIEPEEGIENWE
jgi:hypothetical protein